MPALGSSCARRRAVGAAASLSLGLGSLASLGSGQRSRRVFVPWLRAQASHADSPRALLGSHALAGYQRPSRIPRRCLRSLTSSAAALAALQAKDDGSVPRVDARSLKPGDLVSQTRAPVVLVNLAECWPARHCWSREYLATVHGDITVAQLRLSADTFARDTLSEAGGNAMYADHARNVYVPFARPPEQMQLRDFVLTRFDDYYFEIGEDGAAGRLSLDAFGGPAGLPTLLATDDLTQLTFGMGPAGDGVMFHAHTATWNALMYGNKEWVFYSPESFTGETYERLAMLEARALPEALASSSSSSRGSTVAPMRCMQRPGEVVYIPDGWWHATFSHTETACIGGQRHKQRLPSDWAKCLLDSWPTCGLALNAVAKERSDPRLFEASVAQEPYNLRFVIEHINFLQERGEWHSLREVAVAHRERMGDAMRRGLLAQVELSAVMGQLGERLYHAVEAASALASVDGAGAQLNVFREAVQLSQAAHTLVMDALDLDPGNPLATALSQAINARAEAAMRSYR